MMSIRSLLADLSKESAEEQVAEKVLDSGELLDGTPVDAEKKSEILEMLEHADKARAMSRQLNELADKADELLREDKVHLINEISTEAMQMNYRHIMENAGLSEGVVSFESSDKAQELHYLGDEARKMSTVADALEDRILDFSPEGKIISFLRGDKIKIKAAMGSLRRLDDPTKKDVNVSAAHKNHYKFLFRNGQPIKDLAAEIKREVGILEEAEKELGDLMVTVRDMMKAGKPASDFKPVKMKIFDEKLLGNKHFHYQKGDAKVGLARTASGIALGAWVGSNVPSIIAMSAISPVTSLIAGGIAFGMYKGADSLYNKTDQHVISFGDFSSIRKDLEKLLRLLDHDRHEKLITEMNGYLQSLSGDDKKQYKSLISAFVNVGELIYNHSFFVVDQMRSIAASVK